MDRANEPWLARGARGQLPGKEAKETTDEESIAICSDGGRGHGDPELGVGGQRL
jgi:hypothetical protein